MTGRFQVRPPTRSRASSTITERPARATARAALKPARPAPTTTTSAVFGSDELASDELGGSADASARVTRGREAAAAPAAAEPISVRLVKRVCVSPPTTSHSPGSPGSHTTYAERGTPDAACLNAAQR